MNRTTGKLHTHSGSSSVTTANLIVRRLAEYREIGRHLFAQRSRAEPANLLKNYPGNKHVPDRTEPGVSQNWQQVDLWGQPSLHVARCTPV